MNTIAQNSFFSAIHFSDSPVLQLDVDHGPWYELKETRLLYTAYCDEKANNYNRLYVVPAWTEIKFDKNGRATAPLFPEGTLSASQYDFIEMNCYRSI